MAGTTCARSFRPYRQMAPNEVRLAPRRRMHFPSGMLTEYIAKAVETASYEKMEKRGYFATLPGFKGLWAEGKTVEAARRELISSLEDWLLLALRCGDDVPVVGGIDLNKLGRHAKAR